MSEEKHIHYSAADIGRYHKGLMTVKERHALEKAALDDPFLADAMEGYANVPTDINNDIATLNEKLDERISKVLPLKKTGFTWLRVAALFVVIAGAGLLAYNYLFQSNKNDVAVIGKKDTVINNNVVTDTAKESAAESTKNKSEVATEPQREKEQKNNNENNKGSSSPVAKQKVTVKETSDDEIKTRTPAKPQKFSDAAVEKANGKKSDTIQHDFNVVSTSSTATAKNQTEEALMNDKKAQPQYKTKSLSESAANKGIAAQNNQTHIFRGQVLDQNNSPLPFANVTIVPDNIGTYTDVKGNFTLISPDSTLAVQVRSVGFENKTTTLQTMLANNSIKLEQDTKNIPSTVISNRNINSGRRQMDNNMKVEEPEPADGWYNYDTYIVNNIKISDEIKMKTDPSSEVELSFDVNESGEPVNIKVEKSICKECDAEAIRLLKEGPKWKKYKRNKRAKISVAFQ